MISIHIDFMQPLDKKRCQAEFDNTYGATNSDGTLIRQRCGNDVIVIVHEVVDDGEIRGQIAICQSCLRTLQYFTDGDSGLTYSFIKAKLS